MNTTKLDLVRLSDKTLLKKNIMLFKSLKLKSINVQPIYFLNKINNTEYVTKAKQLIDSINKVSKIQINKTLHYDDMEKKMLNAYYISAYLKKTESNTKLIQCASSVVNMINNLLYTKNINEQLIQTLDTYFNMYTIQNIENDITTLILKKISLRQIKLVQHLDVIDIDIKIRELFEQIMVSNKNSALLLFLNNYRQLCDSMIINDFWKIIIKYFDNDNTVYYLLLSYIKIQLIKLTANIDLRTELYYSIDLLKLNFDDKQQIIECLVHINQIMKRIGIIKKELIIGEQLFEVIENICSVISAS